MPSAFIDGLADVFLGENSQLHTVHLWSPLCIDARTFSLLTQLPNLTTLHLNLLGIVDTNTICQSAPKSGTFPNLQNVYLAGILEEFHKTLRYFGNSNRTLSLGFSVREIPQGEILTPAIFIRRLKFPKSSNSTIQRPKGRNRCNHGKCQLYPEPGSLLSRLICSATVVVASKSFRGPSRNRHSPPPGR